MKKILIAAVAVLALTFSPPASAASTPSLTLDGTPMGSESMTTLLNGTTYVSLRAVSSALDENAVITWENRTAYVHTDSLTLSAKPGQSYMTVNGETVSVPHGVQLVQDRTLVPVRALAQAFGATVVWNPITWEVSLYTTASQQGISYNSDDLYWLSRIISAESRGESLEGKIAVGNVVLNRVKSSEFPNNIYDVIFDSRWGGQFEPVSNGTIYHTPTEESVQAAKLCLQGVNVAGDSLYFLAPALAQNFWIPQNRKYVTTLGCHDFYL